MTTSDEPLTVLTQMYAAESAYFAAGGPGHASFANLAPYFSEHVTLHQAEGLPYGGTWRGHQGMERFFVAMGDTWSVFEMVEQRFLATGSPLVVWTMVRAVSRVTGVKIEFPIVQTISVEHGQITEVHPFYWDTAAITQACTP